MTRRLAVWLGEQRVGTLEEPGRGGLRYVPGVDVPLSVAASGLNPWPDDLTRNWFDGLLPEGPRRARTAARFGLRSEDTFGLLAEIGWECAGAVAVLPENRSPSSGRYEHIDDAGVGARLDQLPSRDLDRDEAIRMSLGGAQDKLLLARFDDSWALPIDGAASTHILKPEPEIWPGLAMAEAWCLDVAKAATQAAKASARDDLGSRPVLVVERYDREQVGNRVVRRHQEDLCQALGLPPIAKYAHEPFRRGDPTLSALARILRERAADVPNELQRLLEQIVVSVALRNTDAHAKNLSLLHARGVVHLSPIYDIAPTLIFLPRQTHVGLPIGGKFKLTDIGSESFIAEAASWGIPRSVAAEVVDEVAARLLEGVEQADGRFRDLPRSLRDAASAGIFQVRQARPGHRSSTSAQDPDHTDEDHLDDLPGIGRT